MEKVLEYAFIISLFVVFASVASLGAIFYNKYFSPEARMLRDRLKQIEALRKADGLPIDQSKAKDAKSELLQDFLDKIAESEYINGLIIGSAVKIRPIEVLGISGSLAAIGVVLALLTPKNALGNILSVLLPIIFAAAPFLYLSFKTNKRRKKFDEKFPEALGLMARALQAGSGLTTAIGMVANELPDPCGTEFKKAFDEINFGITFDDAISNMANRVKSQDLNFFVTALLIQRETGGNLAELLNGLAHTIRERQKLKRKVQIISAEGRLSGNVLIALPIVMAGLLTVINPDYINLLWSTEPGQTAVYTGVTLMMIGAALIQRIVTIKV